LSIAFAGLATWASACSEAFPGSIAVALPTSSSWIAAAIGISTSHVLYALVWYCPDHFRRVAEKSSLRFLGPNAVAVFAVFVALAKFVQQLSVVLWAASVTELAGHTNAQGTARWVTALVTKWLSRPNTAQWACAGVLLTCGQALNGAIYQAIGRDGVYYGFKLGRPVPWCSGFPFNLGFRHPQYVGGLLSQLGVLVPLATVQTMEAGLLPLIGWWIVLYALTSYMEASDDNDQS